MNLTAPSRPAFHLLMIALLAVAVMAIAVVAMLLALCSACMGCLAMRRANGNWRGGDALGGQVIGAQS